MRYRLAFLPILFGLIGGLLFIPPEFVAGAEGVELQIEPSPPEGVITHWALIAVRAARHDFWGFVLAAMLIAAVVGLNAAGARVKAWAPYIQSDTWRFISVFVVSFAGSLLTSYAAGLEWSEETFGRAMHVGEAAVTLHQGYKKVLRPLRDFFRPTATSEPEAST